ncbi:PREDICTED: uncharacterized protein LOC108766804 [Trachymyrmex cornetzi]|uniref:uncharacterized protein LOC108763728 n=1 Tax=Trachymyrmex cornetzi TaxID=471704 RepID=UPI00084F5D9E|nr:PREDICTED: uncharacterized protein LOC108763728 [Trachymyrmex cornetzi]XP_018371812.1 PREDICTED: uncharacterized protein LOC108766804 [Trachymyrmex cornetzi]
MNVSMLLLRKKQQKRWLNRRWLVSPINQKRIQQGDYDHLFQEIKNDCDFFYRYTRMTLEHFEKLVELTKPYLIKKSYRALLPELRLLITIRYLATGDRPFVIALAFRVGESTKKTGRNMHKDIGRDGTFQIVWVPLMENILECAVLQTREVYTITIKNIIV